ncbi:MAG: ABC transporter substrate-binding protein [Erysipelotrichaceae bacterium]|jgi:branched-chain amino acid transport system substrate-binding protein|nr:ABC transporter substrate-binding protein [Erysipelotrichaceae bacterium]MCH4045784.1 ABC transporter substrate-binding protein [Erysipelotrichaceae bacterium]MCH4122992.1 ABC transporter substrate-binding protein [Erysipelotrichaceae bacterium]MCI1384693.1 ABC transporter substrate-binding protein [Solobacterium sp.]
MKKTLAVILSSVMVCSLAGCGSSSSAASSSTDDSSSSSGDVIKIDVGAPMTGDNSEYGIGYSNAVNLMADQVNEDGGITVGGKTYTIKVDSLDDKNNTDEAQIVAEKIVSDKDVIGVIGHFSSGVCMAVAPTYQDAGVIEISPSASQKEYTSIGDYIFRNNSVISVETDCGAEMAVEDLGCQKVGILSIDTEWGQSTAEAMKDNIEKHGGEMVLQQEVSADAVDFQKEIANFKDAGVEAIMVAGEYGTLAPFAVACKNTGYDVKLIGCSNAYTENLIKIAGDAANGIYCPVSFFAEDDAENVQAFVKAYKDRYDSSPSALTAQAYDSAGILIDAIKRADSLDHEKVKDALYDTDYAGVTGETTFDENGDATKEFTKIMVKDGKFVPAEFD